MEYREKNHHNQVLNPFIGFGWYTGNSASKERLGSKHKTLKRRENSK